MALYNELSEELEQTNNGVVALYQELDEKSEELRLASQSKDELTRERLVFAIRRALREAR